MDKQVAAPGTGLSGAYRVRAIRPAFSDVRRLLRRTSDMLEVRSHALKLRYWPDNLTETEGGQLIDLNWEWIKAMPGKHVGELRVDDAIGGQNNLRIIFYRGDPKVCQPLPMIWVLRVLQKKRNDFTRHDLATFDFRRQLVIERFYNYRQ